MLTTNFANGITRRPLILNSILRTVQISISSLVRFHLNRGHGQGGTNMFSENFQPGLPSESHYDRQTRFWGRPKPCTSPFTLLPATAQVVVTKKVNLCNLRRCNIAFVQGHLPHPKQQKRSTPMKKRLNARTASSGSQSGHYFCMRIFVFGITSFVPNAKTSFKKSPRNGRVIGIVKMIQ